MQNLRQFPKHGLVLEYEEDLADNIALLKLPGQPHRCYIMSIPDPRTDAYKELMSGAAATFQLGTVRADLKTMGEARLAAVDDLARMKLENQDLKAEVSQLETVVAEADKADKAAKTEPTAGAAAGDPPTHEKPRDLQ